jgi:anionic cell wall polymer biosynthesis LytR-Cps2A-Psr (LCP) family protein
MQKISVDTIDDGMILAQDICASSGNVLVGKGTKLSASMGRRLKNWGITTIQIEGEEQQVAQGSTSKVSPEEIKLQLQNKFSKVIEKSLMQELFTAVYKFKLERSKR